MSATKTPPPEKKSVVRILSRDAILGAQDVVTEVVDIPEWGGQVYVRGLTGTERDRFESSITDQSDPKRAKVNLRNFRAKLVVLSTYDADGNRLFAEADLLALGQKSAAALQRIFKVAQRLSGISN